MSMYLSASPLIPSEPTEKTYMQLEMNIMSLEATPHSNFLPSIIPTWWSCKHLRWKQH